MSEKTRRLGKWGDVISSCEAIRGGTAEWEVILVPKVVQASTAEPGKVHVVDWVLQSWSRVQPGLSPLRGAISAVEHTIAFDKYMAAIIGSQKSERGELT